VDTGIEGVGVEGAGVSEARSGDAVLLGVKAEVGGAGHRRIGQATLRRWGVEAEVGGAVALEARSGDIASLGC
jgi:hypothetical protein